MEGERLESFMESMLEREYSEELRKESRNLKIRDIRAMAKATPKYSASNVFMKFRKGKGWKSSPVTPSVKVIRGIDNENLALHPGSEYIELLTEWHQAEWMKI